MKTNQNNIDNLKQIINSYSDIIAINLTDSGISTDYFIDKSISTIKADKKLINCTVDSLAASILYFSELQLHFNTIEGYGYILSELNNGKLEAFPILGYKGCIEIAYRNQAIKKIRIQAVYENDEFVYKYGTTEFLQHVPSNNRGELTKVYALAKFDNLEPLFVVVNKNQLDDLAKKSKSNSYSKSLDIFNIMQSKVALKLLFKTLPKKGNEKILYALDIDNKIDYEKSKISLNDNGYEVVEGITKEAKKANVFKKADNTVEIKIN